ncbi:hypothetical protein QBC34DRAFT_4597 [Podospora aff. communis PSN243]|uniref:Pleckstrin homology domain-containing protein n=1 Tax=Podospora aff. communis PSN243 TaxID=3040156 RepID=A0AAV9H688_9PEZI|nr:hypothetical protein QBC34DRAFT_4597 [Podospora aff. communis PSN243]
MESSDAFSQHDAGSEAPRPRRMSMEEDMFYRDVMTSRPANPPSYESATKSALAAQDAASTSQVPLADVLPPYSCDIHLEGVFMRKMELQDTIKPAEYRDWRMVYVELRGTVLNVYNVKKERGWWSSTKQGGSDISPDSPPWVKKSTLEKSYSLLHADAGIAADYRKKRHVIRMRLETDQFLLSCVELGTFVTWLDGLFAAINVAAPLDERDFPRDQSIPRIQRIRWLRGQRPQPDDDSNPLLPLNEGTGSDAAARRGTYNATNHAPENDMAEDDGGNGSDGEGDGDDANEEDRGDYRDSAPTPRNNQPPIMGRLSMPTYPNEHIDPDTGKWTPRTVWTEKHDLFYAKLCYAVLLFKSPRKSNYVVMDGRRWYVDWKSGRMIRLLPPAYGEVDLFGPWQVIAPENRRI